MSDQNLPTPIPAALERDVLVASVIDSSPIAGLLTDHSLYPIHISPKAAASLGLEAKSGSLPELLSNSRLLRPELLVRAMRNAIQGGPARSFHVAESESGSARCFAVTGAPSQHADSRWIWWFDDITESAHLQQFRLLAEIGRSRTADISTSALADQLVDGLLQILRVDMAVLLLGDENGLRVAATRGVLLDDEFVLYPRDRPYLQKAFETLRPIVGDGSEWDAGEQEMTGTHYIVPLLSSGEVIGTLHVGVLDDRAEDAEGIGTSQVLDFAFLEALSTYAGAAIANARLFEEVRTERHRLKAVVDNVPVGMVLYNARGDVLIANDKAAQITERQWANLNTDSRAYRLRHSTGEKMRRVDFPFFRIQQDATPIVNEEVRLEFPTRSKVLSVSVVTIPGTPDKPTSYVGTLHDVTRERTRQSDREDFLQILSHELRSPLTPLTGFLQMVRKQAESGDPIDSALLLRAERQVGRLGRLIDRVLDLSRVERRLELNLEPLDLADLAIAMGELWSSDPRGVDLQVKYGGERALVEGDRDRLDQVLTNLIDNAIKHTPRGGHVEISVQKRGDSAVLRVRDEGSGIEESELPRIFERFYSGDSSMGMGIGLYITRQIVKAHGGEINVTSAPNEGSCFEVALPSIPH